MALTSAIASASRSKRITPRTGPKNSVRWVVLPAVTPYFTPGDQRCGLSPTRRGITAQVSPGSSVLRASSSAPVGGRMSGPMAAWSTVAASTCMLCVASQSMRLNSGSS